MSRHQSCSLARVGKIGTEEWCQATVAKPVVRREKAEEGIVEKGPTGDESGVRNVVLREGSFVETTFVHGCGANGAP